MIGFLHAECTTVVKRCTFPGLPKVLEHHQIYTFYWWHLPSKLTFVTENRDWNMQIKSVLLALTSVKFLNFSIPYGVNLLIY